MSAVAPATRRGRGDQLGMPAKGSLALWEERRKQAEHDRRKYEKTWQICQAFMAGRQWIGWDKTNRRVVQIPKETGREYITENLITTYVWTLHGKLTLDDSKPDITFRRQDMQSEAVARQHKRAFDYAWDEEADGSEIYLDASMKRLVYGLSAIRARPDPTYGKVVGRYPVRDGKTLTDLNQAYQYLLDIGVNQADFKTFREGRMCLEPIGPFGILPPPGLDHERDFPWLVIGRPVHVEQIYMMYGIEVEPEALRTIETLGLSDSKDGLASTAGDLKDHAMLYTGYEMPTRDKPLGSTFCWTTEQKLHEQDQLTYVIKGVGKIGIVFLKWHAVPGRFWPIGVVEPLIGPQRQRNISRSQWVEIKNRNLGRVYAHKNVINQANKPKGIPFELVEIAPGQEFPKETQGTPPGSWIREETEMNTEAMDRIVGLREVSLGGAPPGVSAYSAFALLAEQDDRRVGPVIKSDRIELAKLAKVMAHGIRTFWPYQKHIAVAGDDGLMDAFVYYASTLPEDIYERVGIGAPLPKSQAAEAQKIFDIFDRGISSGQPLPLDWLDGSLREGQALPLPKRENEVAADKARHENALFLHGGGQFVRVAPYDNDELHIQIHRLAQEQLIDVPGYDPIVQEVEQHIQQHAQMAAQKSALQAPTPNGMMAGPGGPTGNVGGFGPAGAAASAQERTSPTDAVYANRHSALPGNVRVG